jgi:endonuclease-3 related protein
LEVAVGAILTQNTSWANVEKAISNLKKYKLLNAQRLYRVNSQRLAEIIRPAGFYNLKSKRLKNFVNFLFSHHKGNLDLMFKTKTSQLRRELLAINGLGPETVDSILLYAGSKPIFVIDAYTKRILSRHHLLPRSAEYGQVQEYFMKNLPKKVKLFNEFHALFVQLAKDFCRKKPICSECPLLSLN